MTMTTTNPPRTRTPVLGGLLALLAAGVLTQALLAGVFIAVNPGAQLVHLIVGSALPWVAIVPAVVAWVRAAQRAVSPAFATMVTLLAVGLWVQEVLGHIGLPLTIAVHVPLGVALFGASTALAISAFRGRPPRRAD